MLASKVSLRKSVQYWGANKTFETKFSLIMLLTSD